MGTLEAVGLAVLQGLTEFLPVSSSGHLAVGHWLFQVGAGGDAPLPLGYVVMVHLGTLVAVVVYYRRDLARICRALFMWRKSPGGRIEGGGERRLALLLVIATIPGAIGGYLFEDELDRLINTPWAVGVALLVTATALVASELLAKLQRGEQDTTVVDALVVGVAQMCALVPGISRSGSCIAAGLARGFDREWAPRFAFLMSVPVIFGGALFKIVELVTEGGADRLGLYGLCAAVSAVTGYLAIVWVLRWVRAGNLKYFAAYCYVLGATVIILHASDLL
ncbi:MAG: undecaprenyl-diphosphate phosphatase [Armatimonadetes bacterium]|nr:undecaprenyl-diphosphate phosphatase [Armatimonadota bacterium]